MLKRTTCRKHKTADHITSNVHMYEKRQCCAFCSFFSINNLKKCCYICICYRGGLVSPTLCATGKSFCNAPDVITAFSGLINGLRRNLSCHCLGLICPNNFICSFLNFLFAYHFPPRQPRPYLQYREKQKEKP